MESRNHLQADAAMKAVGRIAATGGIVALVLAGACAACAAPAVADEAKHAIPSIHKAVSVDKGGFAQAAAANAGSALRYRLTLTLPEDAESLETLAYTVHDKPDPDIAVNLGSVDAYVESADGNRKAALSPRVSASEGLITIRLGDLVKSCPDIAFGDSAVVVYTASLRPSASNGEHPNVAQLFYDRGNGTEQTVGVMAVIRCNGSSSQAASPGRNLPKTGDNAGAAAASAVAAAISALAATAASRRRRPDAPGNAMRANRNPSATSPRGYAP